MPPIICTGSDELEANLLSFQSGIEEKGLVPSEHRTQGGTTNAPLKFSQACVAAFDGVDEEELLVSDLCKRAAKLANDIVTFHVFYNGNGRTSMYAIYLFMACWGYKFYVPPIALHAYMYGETQRDALPSDLSKKIGEYLIDGFEEKVLRSHLSHVVLRLRVLEDARKKAVKYNEGLPRLSKPVMSRNVSAVYVDSGGAALYQFDRFIVSERERGQKQAKDAERFSQTNQLFEDIKRQWSSEKPIPFMEIGGFIKEFYRREGRVPKYSEFEEARSW